MVNSRCLSCTLRSVHHHQNQAGRRLPRSSVSSHFPPACWYIFLNGFLMHQLSFAIVLLASGSPFARDFSRHLGIVFHLDVALILNDLLVLCRLEAGTKLDQFQGQRAHLLGSWSSQWASLIDLGCCWVFDSISHKLNWNRPRFSLMTLLN